MTTATFPFATLETRSPGTSRDDEARKARRRLYPVSVLYTASCLTVLAMALRLPSRGASLAWFGTGVLLWTAMEYWTHRYVLHGRFPDGPGLFRRFCHRFFDHLHLEHHRRPWDGNHVNGTVKDTLPFVAGLALLSTAFPAYSVPLLVAGFVQAYVLEEWVHHSVHFCDFKGRYFQYIKRHHLYHHSPKGSAVAYGLTNGFWDVVGDSRIPAEDRRAVHA